MIWNTASKCWLLFCQRFLPTTGNTWKNSECTSPPGRISAVKSSHVYHKELRESNAKESTALSNHSPQAATSKVSLYSMITFSCHLQSLLLCCFVLRLQISNCCTGKNTKMYSLPKLEGTALQHILTLQIKSREGNLLYRTDFTILVYS